MKPLKTCSQYSIVRPGTLNLTVRKHQLMQRTAIYLVQILHTKVIESLCWQGRMYYGFCCQVYVTWLQKKKPGKFWWKKTSTNYWHGTLAITGSCSHPRRWQRRCRHIVRLVSWFLGSSVVECYLCKRLRVNKGTSVLVDLFRFTCCIYSDAFGYELP